MKRPIPGGFEQAIRVRRAWWALLESQREACTTTDDVAFDEAMARSDLALAELDTLEVRRGEGGSKA